MPIDGLPASKRSKVFRAIESILKGNPVLSGVVKTWRSWEGNPGEDGLPPTADECPWVRLTAIGKPNDKISIESYKYNFAVQVDIAVAGSKQDDALDLWEAIELAAFNDSPYGSGSGQSVQQFLRQLFGTSRGVCNIVCTIPAMWPQNTGTADQPVYIQRASGEIQCFFLFP